MTLASLLHVRPPKIKQVCKLAAFSVLAIALLALPSVSSAANPLEGQQSPTWPEMADMGGTMRSLEQHLGKDVILLDFWSIYCVSCIQEMPSLVALYDKYKDKGFMLYGIDLDSFSPRRVQKFINGLTYEIPYPVIIDRKREIAGAYKVGMLPTTIIIDKKGKVRMFHIGYAPGDEKEFDHLIESLLK